MRVTVAAWIGSANAGDDLIFRALHRKLVGRGARVTAISTRPTAMSDAVGHLDAPAIVDAVRRSDAVVFGGGGLLQDQTSAFNLPYHLSRVVLAHALRTPFAAVGIGAGPLHTRSGRQLVRRALRPATAIAARDDKTLALLRALGLTATSLAADLALSLPSPTVAAVDRICACLRPWRAARGRLPVMTRTSRDVTAESMVARLAAGLDQAAAQTGLPVHLVAMQPGWDDLLHRRVAARMTADVELASPPADQVLDVLAASRVIVAMRYHAGIAAVLSGRPAVLIGYDPKLEGLQRALGPAGALLDWSPDALTNLGPAVAAALPHSERVVAARERLRARERVNDLVLDDLLETAELRR